MAQGESSREKAKRALLSVAVDNRQHKSGDFIKALKGQFAKNTIYKYLKELVAEELMQVKPGSAEESFKPKYVITKRGLQKVDHAMKEEHLMEVSEWLDKMSDAKGKLWLVHSVDRIIELTKMLWAKDQRIQDDMTDSIIWLRTIRKLNQLSGKELQTWDVKKYREDLRREFRRREAAMIEYNKRYPERPEKLLQNPIKNSDEYAKGFEEYYKEFSKKESE